MCFYYEELFNSCAIVMLNIKCIADPRSEPGPSVLRTRGGAVSLSMS